MNLFKRAGLALLCSCVFATVPLFAQDDVFKIGTEHELNIKQRIPSSSTSGLHYEETFFKKNAAYVKLHFKNFHLAPGDYIEIFSPETDESLVYRGNGKVVQDGKAVISDFWSGGVWSDKAIVRLYSSGSNQLSSFEIDKVAYGFTPEEINKIFEDQGRSICGADNKDWAKCHEGTDMYDKARAVSRLYINGSSACTGWLLGSEGHLMTNNHCISSQSTANNTEYEFMGEGATCNTNCGSFLSCRGTIAATSGTLIRTNSTHDYTLVKLPGNLSTTYGYLSFRSTLPSVGERIYIPQHPGAKGKQISVWDDQSNDYSNVATVGSTVRYYADTEGGSSGSPVLGYSDNLVIALHNTGGCTNGGHDNVDIINSLGSQMPANGVGSSTPTVTANFTASPTTVVAGNSVQFTNSSNNATSYSWTFTGGSPASSSQTNPSVTYNTPGTYSVSLTASGSNGSDTETKSGYITVTDGSATETVGNTTVFGSNSTSANRRAMPYTMPETGIISSISMYHQGGSGDMILAVYDGTSSAPGSRIATTSATPVSSSTGWQTINLTSSVTVTGGSTIWLAWVYESNPGIAYSSGSPGRAQASATWSGGMPSSFGSSSTANYLYSIYATYAPTTNPPGDCETGNISLSITLDNYPQETSWTLSNSSGTVASDSYSTANPDGSTVTETFMGLANGDYTFTINDSYGDGICCGYGNGSYTLTGSSGIIVSGGDFGSSESTNFCISGNEKSLYESMEEVAKPEIQAEIFPVPSTDVLNIYIDQEIDQVQVLTMVGQTVENIPFDRTSNQLNISQLTPGTYLVRIVSNNQELIKRFVKQ